MIDRILLKRDARNMRVGHYYSLMFPIVLSIIAGVVLGVLSYVGEHFALWGLTTIVSLCSFVITGLLNYLNSAYFLNFAKTQQVRNKEYFYELDSFGHAIKVLLTNLFSMVLIALGFVCLIIPGIYLAFSYSQVNYILSEHKDLRITEVLSLSRKMMQGYKWDYFVFILSFFGWMLLCALTCGIMYLWIGSYFETARAMYYLEISSGHASGFYDSGTHGGGTSHGYSGSSHTDPFDATSHHGGADTHRGDSDLFD